MTLVITNSPVNAGDVRDSSLIPESGRSPGGGHGNPFQYSCLENPMDISRTWRSCWHWELSFVKYLTRFILWEFEKVRNVDLDPTSVLLIQGECTVPLHVNCIFLVRASWELLVFIHVLCRDRWCSGVRGTMLPKADWISDSMGLTLYCVRMDPPSNTDSAVHCH